MIQGSLLTVHDKPIKFPKGKYFDNLSRYLKSKAGQFGIKNFIAIDPATGGKGSKAGYAVFIAGKLVTSGTLQCHERDPIHIRLNSMSEHLSDICHRYGTCLLAIELLRGGRTTPTQLIWSVGSIISSVSYVDHVEVAVNIWKAYAGKDHVKSDESDAVVIGQSIIRLYEEVNNDQPKFSRH